METQYLVSVILRGSEFKSKLRHPTLQAAQLEAAANIKEGAPKVEIYAIKNEGAEWFEEIPEEKILIETLP